MKNISLSLAALILSIAAVNTSSAQSDNTPADASLASNNIVLLNNSYNNIVENNNVDARAVKNFKKEFAKVDNAQWSTKTDGFESRFEQKNIQYKVSYNQKGDWQTTERIYSVNNLPVDIKHNIETVYLNYTINLVEEIATRQKTTYIVHLQNKEWSLKVKVDGDEMETIQTYKSIN